MFSFPVIQTNKLLMRQLTWLNITNVPLQSSQAYKLFCAYGTNSLLGATMRGKVVVVSQWTVEPFPTRFTVVLGQFLMYTSDVFSQSASMTKHTLALHAHKALAAFFSPHNYRALFIPHSYRALFIPHSYRALFIPVLTILLVLPTNCRMSSCLISKRSKL